MQTIHAIQTVTGPTLSIAVPAEFHGKKVEITVTELPPAGNSDEHDFQAKLAALTLEKPELSDDLKRRLAENPNLLEGSVLRYDDPFGPACDPDDWEVLRDSP